MKGDSREMVVHPFRTKREELMDMEVSHDGGMLSEISCQKHLDSAEAE